MGWVDGTIALLCLLAAAALPARAGVARNDIAPLLIGFVAGAAVLWAAARTGMQPAATSAMAVALWATAELLWSVRPHASLIAAGTAAGGAASLYSALAAPMWLAFPLALAVPCAALALASRGRLGESRLRDEALVGLTWAAVLAAAGPALAAGWDSAVQLNRATSDGGTNALPLWVWSFLALATGAGLLKGWFLRR